MAQRIPRDESLSRVHGVGALFSAAYGNVGSSIYYALGVTAAFALGLTPVAFIISGLIFAATAATYAEATVMFPEAGGSSSFARHAFNEFVSFIAAWGQMLNYTITVAISAFFVPHYLAVFWPWLGDSPGDIIGGAVLIVALALINIRGTEESAKLNLILAVADLATQVILVGIGLVLVLSPEILVDNVHFGVAPTWTDFLLGIAVGMIAYTGIETISNMAEEAKNAARTIPRSVGLTVVAVLALYLLIPIVALSAMPVTQDAAGHYTTALGSTFADDPILGIVENLGLAHLPTEVLRYYVGILAAVILLIATNAGLIGVSRLTYSMGQHRQLPEGLRQVHPKYRTPYIAILIFAAIAIVTLLPGQTDFLATMYSFGAMLSFTIAHVAVIQLRRNKPDVERTWKPPLNFRAFGFEVPISAVLGGLGTFIAWLVVMALNPRTLIVGLGWMALGIAVYVLYRRNQGLPLTQTVKVVLPEPLGVEEVEYRSVLVAFEDDEALSPEMVATAVKLAGKRRRGIHVHSMMTVPTNLPLNAEMSEREAEAQSKIEEAKLIGGQRVTGHVARVRPGQAGYSVADEAAEIKAEAIVVGLRYRNGVPLYDKTLQTILGERPCRVIVVSDPTDKPPAIPGAALAETGR
ncbi:MAG: basic amino acid/polyamine antiporter, family [Solirubrobacterales bacterium]|jgi:APA family basic amino acid/polyamine antiporter|nr:basic amino acid/polyamine antiporter, family [Solirubrobacterales bacterium]